MRWPVPVVRALLLWAGLILCAPPASAAAPPPPPLPAVQAWADRLFTAAVADGRASGAAVALVSEGRTVLLRGYGTADAEGRVAVDPRSTLFSIGSITKNFTGTAVAQLLQARRIESLDDPANKYLKRVRLPLAFGREISVRDLLDHRAGFDDSTFGLGISRAVPTPLSGPEIRRRIPPVIFPPGAPSVYSNSGYGILGVLIEDLTGRSYRDHVERHILVPARMARSFVRTRPQDPVATPVDTDFEGRREAVAQNWAYHPFILPSAGIVSTAEDMARFAAAHLGAHRGGGDLGLNRETALLMHRRNRANAPYVSGFGMSFIASLRGGELVTENAGSGPGFQAVLILLPDRDLALVALIMGGVSDSDPGKAARSGARWTGLSMFAVRQSFLDRFGPSPGWRPMAEPSRPLGDYEGLYRSRRRPHRTLEAAFSRGVMLEVRRGPGDTLIVNGKPGYREVRPGLFWKAGEAPYVPSPADSDIYAFVFGPDGRVRHIAQALAVDIFTPASFSPAFLAYAAIALCLLLATGFRTRHIQGPSAWDRGARYLSRAVATSGLALPASLAAGFWIVGNPALAWGLGQPGMLYLPIALANVIAIAAVLMAVAALSAWARSAHSLGARIHLSVLAAGAVGLGAILGHYNFTGYRIP
ncbi:MAG TPA: serine hydrolase domain-containing protein [Allosphingosinicella sp.]|jgi:CubicO group peptidase (beta-lactamase class C family)